MNLPVEKEKRMNGYYKVTTNNNSLNYEMIIIGKK